MLRTLVVSIATVLLSQAGLACAAAPDVAPQTYQVFVDRPTGYAFIKTPYGWKFIRQLDRDQLARLPVSTRTSLLANHAAKSATLTLSRLDLPR